MEHKIERLRFRTTERVFLRFPFYFFSTFQIKNETIKSLKRKAPKLKKRVHPGEKHKTNV
jgi:hypothetical protein